MGGFGREDTRVIFTPDELLNAVKTGVVDLKQLKIPVQDLEDHSKGDTLSKILLTLQSTWFVVQCITRLVQDLFLTELEVVTLAFSVLNFITYLFWWSKPLNVRTIRYLEIRPPPYIPLTPTTSQTPTRRTSRMAMLDWIRPKLSSISRQLKRMSSSIYRTAIHPISSLGTLFRHLKDSMIYFFHSLKELIDLDEAITHQRNVEKPKQIGHFYRVETPHWKTHLASAVILGTAFNVIHFISWNSIFPTPRERELWRVATTICTAFPVAVLAFAVVKAALSSYTAGSLSGNQDQNAEPAESTFTKLSKPVWLTRPVIVIYVIARISLIVEAYTALRDLPPGAFSDFPWDKFIPHL
ncbi:hypothetical protein BDN72DRAFT_898470 [Pluteus cervinus]|uniref:Uncharacterized protein n=1 Tax=Pluteus cervinus TaxID=181527 RepID=A0ACD3AQU5_9AGAR|nr:hypothetical protein BDN72DRAFT_898470 [Pluteus cervinus]